MKRHVYIVTEINPDHPAVPLNGLEVGSKMVFPWRGKTHVLQTESKGEISYLCTLAHVGRYDEPIPAARRRQTTASY